MGYYINPKDKSKEECLKVNGNKITHDQAQKHQAGEGGQHLVCLIDNGPFTVAAIAYDDRERDEFLCPDPRPREWYLVPTDKLREWCSFL